MLLYTESIRFDSIRFDPINSNKWLNSSDDSPWLCGFGWWLLQSSEVFQWVWFGFRFNIRLLIVLSIESLEGEGLERERSIPSKATYVALLAIRLEFTVSVTCLEPTWIRKEETRAQLLDQGNFWKRRAKWRSRASERWMSAESFGAANILFVFDLTELDSAQLATRTRK